jgi:hypothetical protein
MTGAWRPTAVMKGRVRRAVPPPWRGEMTMAQNGGNAAALVARLARVEAELSEERHKRRRAEQQVAGLRSAISRMQAQRLRQEAAETERRAGQA